MDLHNLNKDNLLTNHNNNSLLRVGGDNNLLRGVDSSSGLLGGNSLLHQAQDVSMLGRGNTGHIQNSMLIGRDNHLVDTSHNNLLPVVQFLTNHPS